MPKCVIYEDDGTIYAEWNADMLVACGLTPPGRIQAVQKIVMESDEGSVFAAYMHMSAQLQVAARDLLRDALDMVPGQPREMPPGLEAAYRRAIEGIERQLKEEEMRNAAQES